MKWGRKKSTGLSPLPQIFPITWLSTLKQKSSTKSQPSKPKQNNKPESYSTSSSIPVCFRSSRLSDGDGSRFVVCSQGDLAFPNENQQRTISAECVVQEDDFWRFSFGDQSNWSKDGEGISEDEESLSGGSNGKSAGTSVCKFPESLTSRTTKSGTNPDEEKTVKIANSTAMKDRREAEQDFRRVTSDKSTPKKHGKKSDRRIAKESTKSFNSEQQPVKNLKSEDKQRESVPKSPRRNRELRRRKMRNRSKTGAHSPGTALRMEMCKIRAVEDLKKAKKKKERKKGRSFESFAVIKSSFNPHQDFRESMMEMICEKEIEDPEELEKLLDCYLSLNSEEYHDIILKVFRQVLFDLNQDSSDSEFEQSYYY